MSQHEMQPEAVRMLLRDHKRVTDLFFHFDQSEEPTHKLSFAETAMNELAVHSIIEEELIYPLLANQEGMEDEVEHSKHEHEEVDELMTQLVNRNEVDDEYCEIFGKLVEMVSHHIQEEEDSLLPKLATVADDQLAERMSELKNELIKLDHDDEKETKFSPQVVLFKTLKEKRYA